MASEFPMYIGDIGDIDTRGVLPSVGSIADISA